MAGLYICTHNVSDIFSIVDKYASSMSVKEKWQVYVASSSTLSWRALWASAGADPSIYTVERSSAEVS